ncbi:MAG TPA: hypothetical protein VK003_12545 [Oceanobacillus sp.]|nr:hypothetical protein [Oceanobacillus sp.]
MEDKKSDALNDVRNYRKLVLIYEALDEQIDKLIMENGGGSENMPPEAFERYRDLARKRDDVLNEIRVMEQKLQLDDELENE